MPTVNGITLTEAARELTQVLGREPDADVAGYASGNLNTQILMNAIEADLMDAGLTDHRCAS